MVDIFSEVEAKGSELNKKGTGCLERGGMQREQHWKLPPLVLGLHLMELIALALLTVHCIFHCHTLGLYLKWSYSKMKQRALEEQIRQTEEERSRLEKEVEAQVQLRLKGNEQGAKFNLDISLENMG